MFIQIGSLLINPESIFTVQFNKSTEKLTITTTGGYVRTFARGEALELWDELQKFGFMTMEIEDHNICRLTEEEFEIVKNTLENASQEASTETPAPDAYTTEVKDDADGKGLAKDEDAKPAAKHAIEEDLDDFLKTLG